MKALVGSHGHTILLLVFILLKKTTQGATNYKLTSVVNDFGGNLSVWLGKRQASYDIYADFCNNSFGWLFDRDMNEAWNRSAVPLITWKVYDCGDRDQPGIMKLIVNHTFDGYLYQFCNRLKRWLAGPDGIYGTNDDRRAYLRLAHEMNGDWFPWSRGSTPQDFVSAWRHIFDILSSNGLDPTRLQWVWSVSYQDVGPYTAEEYWVGENYTHWLGIDGYNYGFTQTWSKWIWPNEVFDNMLNRLRNLSSTKPMSFNEFGTTSISTVNVSDVQAKTEWLNRCCDYINNNTDIKMASYFNDDEGKNDWRVFGGVYGDEIWNGFLVYSAYKTCLQSNDWIGPNMTNPRLITDEQFAGRF